MTPPGARTEPGPPADDGAGTTAGRAWLAALPDELAAQRRVMAGLLDRCADWPLVTLLLVGCSLGRGAADALSDIDAALGVDTGPGDSTRPGDDTRPGDSTRPGNDTRPGDSTRPGNDTRPGDSTRPGNDTRPGDSTRPGNGTRPGDSTRPGNGTRPGDSTQPGNGTRPGDDEAGRVAEAEALVAAALPEIGPLVDVLRHPRGPGSPVRVIFAQYADGTQLDLAIVPDAEISARHLRGGAPDFVPLYQAPGAPDLVGPVDAGGSGPDTEQAAAYAVTGDQVRQWAFHGWCALIDADKYLRRGSLWEAHARLHQARQHIWALWAAAQGALYPWHGLSQVLDHNPADLPPGIDATVAGLDARDLRRAARASATVLATVSEAAARRHPATLPTAMAAYVTRALAREP